MLQRLHIMASPRALSMPPSKHTTYFTEGVEDVDHHAALDKMHIGKADEVDTVDTVPTGRSNSSSTLQLSAQHWSPAPAPPKYVIDPVSGEWVSPLPPKPQIKIPLSMVEESIRDLKVAKTLCGSHGDKCCPQKACSIQAPRVQFSGVRLA